MRLLLTLLSLISAPNLTAVQSPPNEKALIEELRQVNTWQFLSEELLAGIRGREHRLTGDPIDLHGTVVDVDDAPVSNALVLLQMDANSKPNVDRQDVFAYTWTDSKGEYHFRNQKTPWNEFGSPWRWNTLVFKKRCGMAVLLHDSFDHHLFGRSFWEKVQLQDECRVVGFLVQPDGTPGKDIEIDFVCTSSFSEIRSLYYFNSMFSELQLQLRTDDEGEFVLMGLPPEMVAQVRIPGIAGVKHLFGYKTSDGTVVEDHPALRFGPPLRESRAPIALDTPVPPTLADREVSYSRPRNYPDEIEIDLPSTSGWIPLTGSKKVVKQNGVWQSRLPFIYPSVFSTMRTNMKDEPSFPELSKLRVHVQEDGTGIPIKNVKVSIKESRAPQVNNHWRCVDWPDFHTDGNGDLVVFVEKSRDLSVSISGRLHEHQTPYNRITGSKRERIPNLDPSLFSQAIKVDNAESKLTFTIKPFPTTLLSIRLPSKAPASGCLITAIPREFCGDHRLIRVTADSQGVCNLRLDPSQEWTIWAQQEKMVAMFDIKEPDFGKQIEMDLELGFILEGILQINDRAAENSLGQVIVDKLYYPFRTNAAGKYSIVVPLNKEGSRVFIDTPMSAGFELPKDQIHIELFKGETLDYDLQYETLTQK